MAATIETQLELQGIIDALAVDRVIVVCLRAGPDAVATRIADREPDAWPGKASLIAHARVLAESIPSIAGIDVVICTEGRSPVDVAGEINVLLRDHDLDMGNLPDGGLPAAVCRQCEALVPHAGLQVEP